MPNLQLLNAFRQVVDETSHLTGISSENFDTEQALSDHMQAFFAQQQVKELEARFDASSAIDALCSQNLAFRGAKTLFHQIDPTYQALKAIRDDINLRPMGQFGGMQTIYDALKTKPNKDFKDTYWLGHIAQKLEKITSGIPADLTIIYSRMAKHEFELATQACTHHDAFLIQQSFNFGNRLETRMNKELQSLTQLRGLNQLFIDRNDVFWDRLTKLQEQQLEPLAAFGGLMGIYKQTKQDHSESARFWNAKIATTLNRLCGGISATVTMEFEQQGLEAYHKAQGIELKQPGEELSSESYQF